MPCLVVLLALIAPRVVCIALWLLTTFFERATGGNPLLLLLGIAFLPFTVLAYAWAVNAEGGVHSLLTGVVVCVAFLADVSAFEGGRRRRTA